jgi:Glycosyl transferase family 2.
MGDKDDSQVLLSILIPTLEIRQRQFYKLYEELNRQITENSLDDEVELLYFSDKEEHSIGFKRNTLIEEAKGEFVAFIDDDDSVSNDYVPLIHDVIKENPEVDCIGIKGIIIFAEEHSRIFVHSLRYNEYFTKGDVYLDRRTT